jgi:hypothetical protein
MPIGDMTGATSNYLAASRMQAGVNAQKKSDLVSGITQAGVGAMDAVGQKKVAELLVTMGFDPNQAQLIASQGPAAAAQAGLQKAREKLESDRISQEQTFQLGRDKTQFGNQQALQTSAHDNAIDTLGTTQMMGTMEEREKREADRRQSELLASQEAGLLAPVNDNLSIMGGNFKIQREAGESDIYGRARKGGVTQSALHGALSRMPKDRPASTPKWDETPEGYDRKKQIDAKYETPATSNPRNIDPLSDEGIGAKVKLWQQTEGTKKPQEMQADAMLRVQDAKYMAGIPPGDRLTYKALAGKDFMKPEEVRELKRITDAANAAWAAQSSGSAPPGAGDAGSDDMSTKSDADLLNILGGK